MQQTVVYWWTVFYSITFLGIYNWDINSIWEVDIWTTELFVLFPLLFQFPVVVLGTKIDIQRERECDSMWTSKWAEGEKGNVAKLNFESFF